jgi:hypothetical protein
VNHESNDIVIVDVMLGLGEALERLFGFFEAVLTNEVPRRFGCKIGGETQWDWPDPLLTVNQQRGISEFNADFGGRESRIKLHTCNANGIR